MKGTPFVARRSSHYSARSMICGVCCLWRRGQMARMAAIAAFHSDSVASQHYSGSVVARRSHVTLSVVMARRCSAA